MPFFKRLHLDVIVETVMMHQMRSNENASRANVLKETKHAKNPLVVCFQANIGIKPYFTSRDPLHLQKFNCFSPLFRRQTSRKTGNEGFMFLLSIIEKR